MGRTLVIFPLPFVGHQNPTFELANILHSRGFSITVIHTRFHAPDPSKYPQFKFHFIDDGLSASNVLLEDVISTAHTLNKECIGPFRACLSQILSNATDDQEPVSCLITDAMWYFSQAVADGLKVPRIVLRTGSMSSFTMFSQHIIDLGDKKPDDLVAELPYLKVKDILRIGKGDQRPLQELASNTAKETKASKGLIFNAIEELEDRSLAVLQQHFPVPIFPIGPFHKNLPSPPARSESSLSWLDTQEPNSVVYVSFGSLAAIDQAGFLNMAWGLANSNQPFLWVIRSDLIQSSDGTGQLPDGFLEKVSGKCHIVGWAPQKEVLAHPAVGVFWTHCGWNSTLESVCEGVPMICSSCFGDQMANARYVSDVWKTGLQLEVGAKADQVEKAIRTLMLGGEIRERAARLKEQANSCLQPGGSSFQHMEDLANLFMSFSSL